MTKAMHTSQRRLVIMVKQPVAGRVKTRLARDIGQSAAIGFYRHTLNRVTTRLAMDSRWQTILSIAPKPALAARSLPPRIPRIAQSAGDLGARMQAIFDMPAPGPVIVIGTDIPGVRPADIAAAFKALGSNDLVFGPAMDGGFWLVGMRRSPRVLDAFRNVRWSTSDTLADCIAGLTGYRIARVATLRDVDDYGDLIQLGRAVGRQVLPFSQNW